jgi:hypothetical protein
MLHRSELPDTPMKPETGTRVEEYCAKPTGQKLLSMQQERTTVDGLLEFARGPFKFGGAVEPKLAIKFPGAESPCCQLKWPSRTSLPFEPVPVDPHMCWVVNSICEYS